VRLGGAAYELSVLDEVRARTRRPERAAAAGGAAALRAPMPGLIVEIKAAVGDRLAAGQPLVVMEAMKMQNELASPGEGVVEQLHVSPGQTVESGQILITLAPAGEGA
jgi:biotin carboxyl carrier protein